MKNNEADRAIKITLTLEQETRLRELLERTDPEDSAYPGLTDDEAAEIRQIICGLDEVEARFITAIERGKIKGDIVEIPEA
jgi:hypothetical protein